MEKIVLQATRRSVTGKKVGAMRRAGQLPAVLYGHHFESTPITLDLRETTHTLHGLSSSSLITINLEGQEYAALVREKQRNYVKGTLLHIDFQVVSLTEKIRTKVSIELEGVAPAVKDFNGVLVTGVDKVEVECLPQDLPQHIKVDISSLAKIGDGIYVRDLPTPVNVEILENGEEMVAVVTGVEEEKEGEASSMAEPELIERGKKEEVVD